MTFNYKYFFVIFKFLLIAKELFIFIEILVSNLYSHLAKAQYVHQ